MSLQKNLQNILMFKEKKGVFKCTLLYATGPTFPHLTLLINVKIDNLNAVKE